MTRRIMAVFSDPTSPDREAEYNTWYNEVHLKDLLAIPGVVGATRHTVSAAPGRPAPEQGYLALYEIEAEPAEILAEFGARSESMELSPALDLASTRILFLEPVEGGEAAAASTAGETPDH